MAYASLTPNGALMIASDIIAVMSVSAMVPFQAMLETGMYQKSCASQCSVCLCHLLLLRHALPATRNYYSHVLWSLAAELGLQVLVKGRQTHADYSVAQFHFCRIAASPFRLFL